MVAGYVALYLLLAHLQTDDGKPAVLIILDWLCKLGSLGALFWFLFRLVNVLKVRLQRWTEHSQNKWDDVMAVLVIRALRLVIPLIGVLLVAPVLNISPESNYFFKQAASLLLILAIGVIFYQLVDALEGAVLRQFRTDVEDNLEARKINTQVKVLKKLAIVAIVIFTAASMLMMFESFRRLGTSIMASAGVIGIVVGFAAQKSIATVVAGFQIAMTQPIRLDDVVIVEGEWGRIEEITLTYVVVRIWDLRRLILPIGYFIEHPFQNWTRVSADILGSVFLYLDYTVPLQAVREELTRLLEQSPYWDKKVNVVQVTDAKERTIEVRALMSASDSSQAWNLRCEVREKLLDFLRQNYPGSLPRLRAELHPLPEFKDANSDTPKRLTKPRTTNNHAPSSRHKKPTRRRAAR